jgi:transcriptional regulator with XRE-family HTH domain
VSRPIPDHGTASRYRGDGRNKRWAPCRCAKCLAAYRRRRKTLELRTARTGHGRHPAEKVADHINMLIRSGWTLAEISETAGVDRRGMYRIRNGQQRGVNYDTAARIFALKGSVTPRLVDATGSCRRLQALCAVGWPLLQLADRTNISATTFEDIVLGTRIRVTHETHETIRNLYRQLAFKPGPSGWVRAHAAKKGWHGPLAWDDIDDPNCEPEVDKPVKPTRGRNESPDPLRVMRLTDQGLTAEQIARTLGVHKRTITRTRARSRQQLEAAA